MNRREFLLAAAAPGTARGETALPDMLLEYFAGRLDPTRSKRRCGRRH